MQTGISYEFDQHIGWLEKYANHPSCFLTMNSETEHFSVSEIDGYIAYRDDGKCLYQLCGVMADEQCREELLNRFLDYAQSIKRKVCCVQLRSDQVSVYENNGFCINQMGLSYSLPLADFSTAGTRFMKVRNKVSRAKSKGVVVRELGHDAPFTEKEWDDLMQITDRWLDGKGGKKLLQFMVGEMSPNVDARRRVFAAYHEGKMIGFTSFTRSYGNFDGWMHDLSRRELVVPPGVMELINVVAIERFKEEGVAYLNFGFTPFSGISGEFDCFKSRSHLLTWLLLKLEKYGQKLYPALSQVSYKRKWQPLIETPEYVAFHGKFRWSYILGIMKITESI